MSVVSAKDVVRLREVSGVGMQDCKKALDEAGGNFDLALEHLRKRGLAQAAKKATREAKEGVIRVADDSHRIAVVEVNCETDFVVRNDDYRDFAQSVTELALHNHPKTLEALRELCEDRRAALVGKIGENIVVNRYTLFEKKEGHSYGIYVHGDGKIVCVVDIKGAHMGDVAKEVAMHSAAAHPQYLDPEDVPSEIISKEEEIARAQIHGKPENVVQKIIEGKKNTYFAEVCLKKQKFIKDESLTIEEYVRKKGKELGAGDLTIISSFVRVQVGV
ncbi:MAG: elongation factor Ts [Chlamydiae bacterium]|nr:elongation factor Ts [Chlamydiota bacterium]